MPTVTVTASETDALCQRKQTPKQPRESCEHASDRHLASMSGKVLEKSELVTTDTTGVPRSKVASGAHEPVTVDLIFIGSEV